VDWPTPACSPVVTPSPVVTMYATSLSRSHTIPARASDPKDAVSHSVIPHFIIECLLRDRATRATETEKASALGEIPIAVRLAMTQSTMHTIIQE
jgi:hypothetical protein